VISSLVTLLSLNLTLSLIQSGQVLGTFPITNTTVTTPITVTSPSHGVPPSYAVHAVISGVTGALEANGLWVLTVVDANTFSLSTFAPDGTITPAVGANAYVSGGTISYALSDYAIQLGRRNIAKSTAVVSPRVVMVPTFETAWTFDPDGGIGAPNNGPPVPGPIEVQNATLSPESETEPTTFEVYVTGCANPPSPDFGDFDATQAIVWALRTVMTNAVGLPRCRVLRASWPSQLPAGHPLATGLQSQRGQQWMGVVEFAQGVRPNPLQYIPAGTTLTYDIGTNPPQGDDTIVVVPS
jgi:hypothetical protein